MLDKLEDISLWLKVSEMKNTVRRDKQVQQQKEALRSLERLQGQSEVVGTSTMIKAAKAASAALSKIDENDPIEVLGKKIGRALGIVAVIGLTIYLAITYF